MNCWLGGIKPEPKIIASILCISRLYPATRRSSTLTMALVYQVIAAELEMAETHCLIVRFDTSNVWSFCLLLKEKHIQLQKDSCGMKWRGLNGDSYLSTGEISWMKSVHTFEHWTWNMSWEQWSVASYEQWVTMSCFGPGLHPLHQWFFK